ncbi:hemolysin III [Lachnospiraceae bacterium KM106-2]|nr:hemolysin III [Lachnospiraceae bacterium KM106-2]
MNQLDKKKMSRAEQKKYYRELNEPPHLTVLEEIGNAVTHGIGAALALVGFILLLLKSDTSLKIMASCFYGVSLFFLMLMSCLYHAFKSGSTIKRIWRRFDYSSIYLLIGGTFAPLYLVYWGNTLGIVLFCIQWVLIALGIAVIGIFGPGRIKWLHFTMYFVIGWSGIMFFPDWIRNNRPLLWMILLGGVVYTIGMIPFVKDKKYDHFIWHFFVLGGAILHWFGIYFFIY